ncbi:MAG: tetratricopeptide repeat protein [Planctomycetes bacterium]|nr:tetratricopeptide repeat protein [Planctomycetota bacterium]
MSIQRYVKTKGTGKLVLAAVVVIALVGGAVHTGLRERGNRTGPQRPDANQVRPDPALETGNRALVKAELAQLSACFVSLEDANAPSDVKDRALRQEQLRVGHCLCNAFQRDADALFILAMAYQEQGQSVKAVEYLIQCLKLQPDRADAYDQLGRIAQQRGDNDKAVSLYQEAVTLDPTLPGLRYRLAEILHADGKLEQALTEIARDIRLNPQTPASHVLKGQICLQMQDYPQAKGAYEQAIRLNPDLTKPYFALATVCARMGLTEQSQSYRRQFKDAETARTQAAKDHRQSFDPLKITSKSVAHTHTDTGRIYYAQGKAGQAALLWQRARILDPENVLCRMPLADVLLRSGQLPEALAVYQEVVAIQPGQGVAHFFVGHIHEEMAQWDAAERAYQQTIAVTPTRPEGYQAMARFYLTRNFNVSRAGELARQAIALSPVAANYYLLAQICYRQGDSADAMKAVTRALELSPDHMEYMQLLQRIRELK